MVRIVVGGAEMPAVDKYSVGSENIGEFVRNANGNLVGDLVAVKAVLSVGWRMLSGEDYGRLMGAAGPIFVDVEYFCPALGRQVVKQMYVRPGRGRIALESRGLWWKDVGCEFVEK